MSLEPSQKPFRATRPPASRSSAAASSPTSALTAPRAIDARAPRKLRQATNRIEPKQGGAARVALFLTSTFRVKMTPPRRSGRAVAPLLTLAPPAILRLHLYPSSRVASPRPQPVRMHSLHWPSSTSHSAKAQIALVQQHVKRFGRPQRFLAYPTASPKVVSRTAPPMLQGLPAMGRTLRAR